jgi:hypothetical protein
VTDNALVSFLLYLVLFDAVDYCAAPAAAPWAGGGSCMPCTTASAR